MATSRQLFTLSTGLRPTHLHTVQPRYRPTPLHTPIAIRFNSSFPPKSPHPDPKHSDPSQASLKGKLATAWSTPTKWYPIPIALGALVLLAVQFRKERTGDGLQVDSQRDGGAVVRSRRVDGPWQVRVLGALPLRSLSQLWGYLNSLVLPVWFRPFGFKLYASIFGCNLDEVPEDLTHYDSLGEFFYREIKEGARPIADASMVSPADGRVLHFGEIVGERVEQVKGITYSLQALLGTEGSAVGETTKVERKSPSSSPDATRNNSGQTTPNVVVDDKHFAEINDISYSLGSLLGTTNADPVRDESLPPKAPNEEDDASHTTSKQGGLTHDASVALKLGKEAVTSATEQGSEFKLLHPDRNSLYFCVIYLAPGDYHRFHSPVAWVVERRRHFTGDLFSVSPYIVNRLKDLFVLNERVALLGRWKHGFFSMVPVGATNVGSIRINFDESLRTNTRHLSHPPHTFTEAVYSSASTLKGQPLLPGEEMGGFRLGSTIVLVFEAPRDWRFTVKAGEKVKVGESLGEFNAEKKKGPLGEVNSATRP